MSETAKNKQNFKRNNMVIVIVAVFALTVTALVGVIVYLLGRGNNVGDGRGDDKDVTRRTLAEAVRVVVDESHAEDVMSQMREEVAEGMFECQMSMKWTFANGTAASQNSYVANSRNNTHPICFDVYLRDTDELIYSSPVLPVGTEIKNIKLDKELSAGEYQATVMYTLLDDIESQNAISKAGFVVTIKILN